MSDTSELTSENVAAAFEGSLIETFDPKNPPDDDKYVLVEGIIHTVAFDKEKLESHRKNVLSWIDQLPEGFLKDSGGGWSFLNLCMRKDGIQWTGFHLVQEQLMTMAIGLGLAQIQLPREMWSVLPGGMPYVVFSKEELSV